MDYKKRFIGVLLPFLIGTPLLCTAYILYDPLQISRKGYFVAEKYDEDMRLQVRGIIENVPFDSVLLGTSMLVNSSAKEASDLLGGDFINLSMVGSNFYERALVLRKLFATKPIKNVIYSLDDVYFKCENEQPALDNSWMVLYDNNPLSDYLVYANKKYMVRFAKDIWGSWQGRSVGRDFFELKTEWFSDPYHAERFGGLQNWVKYKDRQGVGEFLQQRLPDAVKKLQAVPPKLVLKRQQEAMLLEYLERNILSFVKEHPDTAFNMVLPPYYRYRYAEWRRLEPEKFALHKRLIQYMVAATAKYPNLHIYGFEDMDFLDNIANYKDTTHHHQDFNSLITKSIAAGKHELTTENVDAYLQASEKKALDYDIAALNKEAQSLLGAQGNQP